MDNEKKVKSGVNKNKVLTANVAAVLLLLAVIAYVFLGPRGNSFRFKSNNLEFQSNIDGTVSVIGINDEVETISIPSEVRHWWKTYSVTSIAYDAFSGCSSLVSVEIPIGVTEISERAFCDCSNLVSVEIPDSVTEIGDGAFANCISLVSVEIPDSVTEIGIAAFYGCSSLEWVEMSSETTFDNSAFINCTNMQNIIRR